MRPTSYYIWYSLLAILFFSCGDDSLPNPGDKEEEQTQTFRFRIENVGESSVHTKSDREGRPLFSMSPKQTIDRVDILILRNDLSSEVVYRRTIEGWSDTDNRLCSAYIDGNKWGREAVITLSDDERLEDGASYIVYGIGYHTGSYGDYEAFKDVVVGDKFLETETATIPLNGYAEEIFAGADIVHVRDGQLWTRPSVEADLEAAKIVARRQVGGTFGYFTKIPAVVNGERVKTLRLVATKRNRSIIFGGFRSMEDPENFNQEKVINGMEPRTDFDARLLGSTVNDAFVVYEVDLSKWFPGDEADLPYDSNGDGLLDEADENWQINPDLATEGAIKLAAGSVFGDSYLVAAAVDQEEINRGMPTFQLQLLDVDNRILKAWTPLVRQEEELARMRTIVTLVDGRTVITTESNPESLMTFSIARNNLFTLGEKNNDQIYGQDVPLDLSNEKELVMDVNPEWEALEAILIK